MSVTRNVAGRVHNLPAAPVTYSREAEAEFRQALEQSLTGSHAQLGNALVHNHAGEVIRPAGITVGADAAPDASAAIDMAQQTTAGLLVPKLTTAQRDAIGTPATGLLLFNTTTGQYEWYDGAAWVPVATAPPSGIETLLARIDHDPGTAQDVSNTTTTYVDINAATLALTFTTPASGKVRIVLRAMAKITSASTSNVIAMWGLRDSGGDISGTEQYMVVHQSPSATSTETGARVTYEKVFTLTPNTAYTWKWAQRRGANAATAHVYYGLGRGMATMEAWAVE